MVSPMLRVMGKGMPIHQRNLLFMRCFWLTRLASLHPELDHHKDCIPQGLVRALSALETQHMYRLLHMSSWHEPSATDHCRASLAMQSHVQSAATGV